MAEIERQSPMDPAEGSREAVDANLQQGGTRDGQGDGNAEPGSAPDQRPGFSHGGTGDVPRPQGEADAGGISNRPLSEEQANQQELPLRGNTQDEGHRDRA